MVCMVWTGSSPVSTLESPFISCLVSSKTSADGRLAAALSAYRGSEIVGIWAIGSGARGAVERWNTKRHHTRKREGRWRCCGMSYSSSSWTARRHVY